MPNGRGTIDCHSCRHHYFVTDAEIAPRQHAMCRLWGVELPRMEFGQYNLLCREHQSEGMPPSVALMPPAVANSLQPGVLYAVFYNAMNNPSAYALVRRLDEPDRHRPEGER